MTAGPLRDTQLAMASGMERPVGRIPLSVQTGNNADLIAGTGPGGHNITTIRRARRAHSYLLVFMKGNRLR